MDCEAGSNKFQQTSLCPDLEQQPSYLNNCFTAKLNKFDFVWISLILATKTKNLTIYNKKTKKKHLTCRDFHPVVSTPRFFHSTPPFFPPGGVFPSETFPFRSTGHQQNDQKGQSKSHQRSKEGNPSYLWCEGFFMWPFGWNRQKKTTEICREQQKRRMDTNHIKLGKIKRPQWIEELKWKNRMVTNIYKYLNLIFRWSN